MKQDLTILALKILCLGAAVAIFLLWGIGGLLIISTGLLGIWLALFIWDWRLRKKRNNVYNLPLRAFQDAIQNQNIEAFEQLLHRHLTAWRSNENLDLCQDVFQNIIQADSLPIMRTLLQHEDAPWWQEKLSHADVLCMSVLHGSPEMMSFLLEQGMNPAQEWESPWLIALINVRIDHARVLTALRADVITPEQQERTAWPPLDVILNSPDFFPTPQLQSVVLNYLKEIQR